MEFDTSVKLAVYGHIVDNTLIPSAPEVAEKLHVTTDEVQVAFTRLRTNRLLVLEPDNPTRIRMAPPFSGVPTQHMVHVGRKSYFANCAWDALGVAAALQQDADIESKCGDCDELLQFKVRSGAPVPKECAVHFAVPAAHWWDDIIFT